MIILCDMDGVVANFVDPVLEMYNNDYNDNLTAKDITQHGMHECVKPECGRSIFKYFHTRGLFSGLPVIEGAKGGIAILRALGHEVVFVTKPVGHSLSCVAEKQSWVDKHFPDIGSDNMVFTGQKHRVIGDVLVDDLPTNLEHFMGCRILLDQPWNQGCNPAEIKAIRLLGWESIVAHITESY